MLMSASEATLSAAEGPGDAALTDRAMRGFGREAVGPMTGLYLCLTCLLLPSDSISGGNERNGAPRR